MDVLALTTGPFRQNGYVVVGSHGDAVVIDPGGEADRFLTALQSRDATLRGIVNTHGHFDHIGAVQDLVEATGAPFLLHSGDHALLRRANLYKALFQSREAIRVPGAVIDLKTEPNPVRLGSMSIEWIETPGHTEGSVCLLIEDALFTGDTLLSKGPGRTDLPGGNRDKLQQSLDVLRRLPQRLQVYPGHGHPSALAEMFASISESGKGEHAGQH